MRDLLEFILRGITANEKVAVSENEEAGHVNLTVEAPEEIMGIIIGKGGKTIKAIRNLIHVRATLEKKTISIILPETRPAGPKS